MKRKTHIIYSVLVLTCLFGCSSDPKQISHAKFLTKHNYSIGQTSLDLYDEQRGRPVKTEIWYPTMDTTQKNISIDYPFILPPTSYDANIESGKFPLILLSHGTGGNRISQMWLASELVGHGYIVASANHFGNTLDNKIPENFVKVWDRPLDISFLLDYLLKSPQWIKSIDRSKIGMVGFSLGGYTGVALSGATTDYNKIYQFAHSEQGKSEFTLPELGDIRHLITHELVAEANKEYTYLKDERISAFAIMAPALGQAFKSKDQFKHVETPFLIIGTENDQRAPVQTNAKHYHVNIENSKYLLLKGEIGHYVFMNEAKNRLKRNAPLIFRDAKSVSRKEVHKKVSTTVIDFFDKHFEG